MSAARQFFPGIHALRIVAAVMVAFEHARFVANGYDGGPPRLFYPGRTGVVLFFAISGFVIALQRNKPIGEFVRHRLLRIYPSYWIALLLEAASRISIDKAVGITLASALLYPSTVTNDFTAIPYWTLVFEVVFYALAALAFSVHLSDKHLIGIAVLWILAVNFFGTNPQNLSEYGFPGWSILLSPAVQVFPMGLICGILFDRVRRLGRWPYAIGAALAFSASLAFAELTEPKLLLQGISAAALIVAVADLPFTKFVKTLGDASYGLYLLHFPAIVLVATLYTTKVGLGWLLVAALLSGLAFGAFDHWLYRQLIRLTRSRRYRVSAPIP
jgi:exopolysaccharide production protein ExoZ